MSSQDKNLHVAYGKGCHIDLARATKGQSYVFSARKHERTLHTLSRNTSFPAQYGLRVRISLVWFDLNNNNNAWQRVQIHNTGSETAITLIPAICWNIWPEKNNQIFNNIVHTIEYYLEDIYFDVISWTGYLMREWRRSQHGRGCNKQCRRTNEQMKKSRRTRWGHPLKKEQVTTRQSEDWWYM